MNDAFLDRYGDNVITIEVEDLGGNAGIYEGPIAITTMKNYKRLIESYH